MTTATATATSLYHSIFGTFEKGKKLIHQNKLWLAELPNNLYLSYIGNSKESENKVNQVNDDQDTSKSVIRSSKNEAASTKTEYNAYKYHAVQCGAVIIIIYVSCKIQ